ncbi:hypothetical protein A8L34_14045 [Bacillus sp. FJAT-27264]|uniref:response regulator n=1 Tax=Paenibacillus sp. (strain DSM 101736 / FJAT-27264) TaxID=1850362 RepID=UPI000807ABBD|nr:response regulator [Bacillus sp. FJAT-27264]OBZ14997.1 hypothetical protein A8L34_14045 [Bacillus sp. FJAT-27264]
MYKVLIADDEWLIREGLKTTVDWQSLHCEIVAEAANGRQALQAVQNYIPDILITDIRMPGMDGLRMAEEARRFHPTLKVIFLTGFDDFLYAQHAVKLQASDFVLKPTNPDELLRSVYNICQEIEDNRQRSSRTEQVLGWMEAGQTMLVEQLLRDQMTGVNQGEGISLLKELLDVEVMERGQFRVVLAELHPTNGSQAGQHVLWNQTVAKLEGCLYASVRMDGSRNALVVQHCTDVLDRLSGALFEPFPHVRIGISQGHSQLYNVEAAYREAMAALEMLRPVDSRMISEYGNLNRWRGASSSTAENIRQIEAYLRLHYAEEISLQGIATKMNMSEAHFSRLFRKHTGVSYIDYVTQLRMEQAKRLLSKPDVRIYEVSVGVGYQDARYFSQLFRKYTGETPTEFKKVRELEMKRE